MFQFTMRGLLGLIVLAAVVCTVLFAIPPGYRVAALAVGAMALPGPLVVGFLYGRQWIKAFAAGALVGYAAWFVILGIPAGWQAKQSLGSTVGTSVFELATVSAGPPASPTFGYAGYPAGTTIYRFGDFVLFAGLYAPWFVVLVGGLSSLCVYELRSRHAATID
jgi:hypothetical protein